MKSIREWTANRYRRWKAFARRQAPYLILLSILLCFVVVFFFNRIVISDPSRRTRSAVAAAGRRHPDRHGVPRGHARHPAVQRDVHLQHPQAAVHRRDRRPDRGRSHGRGAVFGALFPRPGHPSAAAPARGTGLRERGGASGDPVGDADRVRTVQARGDLRHAEGHPGTRQRAREDSPGSAVRGTGRGAD